MPGEIVTLGHEAVDPLLVQRLQSEHAWSLAGGRIAVPGPSLNNGGDMGGGGGSPGEPFQPVFPIIREPVLG